MYMHVSFILTKRKHEKGRNKQKIKKMNFAQNVKMLFSGGSQAPPERRADFEIAIKMIVELIIVVPEAFVAVRRRWLETDGKFKAKRWRRISVFALVSLINWRGRSSIKVLIYEPENERLFEIEFEAKYIGLILV